MSENAERDSICRLAKSLFDRGLTIGSSGNISVRLDDGWLMTPTGSSMGNLDPNEISKLDLSGNLISGNNPTVKSKSIGGNWVMGIVHGRSISGQLKTRVLWEGQHMSSKWGLTRLWKYDLHTFTA